MGVAIIKPSPCTIVTSLSLTSRSERQGSITPRPAQIPQASPNGCWSLCEPIPARAALLDLFRTLDALVAIRSSSLESKLNFSRRIPTCNETECERLCPDLVHGLDWDWLRLFRCLLGSCGIACGTAVLLLSGEARLKSHPARHLQWGHLKARGSEQCTTPRIWSPARASALSASR